ncbi:sn-glycerol-3-phosphate ABC transporter substrate-binding protein UgpB [Desulfosarcina sp.]|uniref:sn-glycerol-3-phosphate ABC transporter substrate-binding protein UgpB n=1 Tax=Desulfosarcina sp. TaxID=2027861 RepID=UPI0039710A11
MKRWNLGVWIAAAALVVAVCGPALAQPTTLQWWHSMKGANADALNEIVAAFNASQKDYVVEATYKGNYDEAVNAAVAAFRAKKQPHILQCFEVGTLTMMLSGAVYPVHQLMADTGYQIDWNKYLQPVLGYYVSEKGQLLSMPFNSSTPVMYYNKDLLAKAGLSGPPRTWDEVGEYTAKLVAAGVEAGLVTGWQSWTMIENYGAMHDLPFATKANGYEGLDCELAFNNPQVVNHIARLQSWTSDGRFAYSGQKFQGPQAAFTGQHAALYIDSVSRIGALKKTCQFAWSAAPMPVEATMKEPLNSIIGGASLWVMKGHPEKDNKGVAAFMAFLAKTENQELWHKKTGYFPITVEAYENLKKAGYYEQNPLDEVGIKQLMRGTTNKNSRGIRVGYFIQIRDIINEELEHVWAGKKTAQQAVDEMVKRGNEQLRSFEKTNK